MFNSLPVIVKVIVGLLPLILISSSFSGCISDDTIIDNDDDGISDSEDNCISIYNPYQLDFDKDGMGDECDGDMDNDGIPEYEYLNPIWGGFHCYDVERICPEKWLPADEFPFNATESVDTDNDGLGNNADTDDDNDGIPDWLDFHPEGNGKIRVRMSSIQGCSSCDYPGDGDADFMLHISIDKECDGEVDIEKNMKEERSYWSDLHIVIFGQNVRTNHDYTFDIPDDTESTCFYHALYEYNTKDDGYYEYYTQDIVFNLRNEEGFYHKRGSTTTYYGAVYFSICFPGNTYESLMDSKNQISDGVFFDC